MVLESKFDNAGIALFVCLILSLIIALILSAEFLHIRLNEKNIGSIKQYDQLFYTIEKKMTYWVHHSFNTVCIVDPSDANDYPQQLLNKSISACHYLIPWKQNNIELWYVAEDLGITPCIAIQKKNKMSAAHFYRMSVLGENKLSDNLTISQAIILQRVYAISEGEMISINKCTDEEIKVISEGGLSWRIVPIG